MNLSEEEFVSVIAPDAEGLYAFLSGLSYKEETCDGMPEYRIRFDDGSQYYLNVTESWVWRGNDREAGLSDDEMALLLGYSGLTE